MNRKCHYPIHWTLLVSTKFSSNVHHTNVEGKMKILFRFFIFFIFSIFDHCQCVFFISFMSSLFVIFKRDFHSVYRRLKYFENVRWQVSIDGTTYFKLLGNWNVDQKACSKFLQNFHPNQEKKKKENTYGGQNASAEKKIFRQKQNLHISSPVSSPQKKVQTLGFKVNINWHHLRSIGIYSRRITDYFWNKKQSTEGQPF